jgi:XTP/dITP diphosphohydrolase
MMKLIFATNNKHKVEEIQPLVGETFELITLKEAGIDIDIPEPYDTLEANASTKSATIFKLTGLPCFSEDTGLEVAVLNGEPGVKSARYAGEEKSFSKNIEKLLENLGSQSNRKARFRTVISLILHENEYFFEGICDGVIEKKPKGINGFGYDPVFTPTGSSLTFGEMELKEKIIYSHRQKATSKLIDFLLSKAVNIS